MKKSMIISLAALILSFTIPANSAKAQAKAMEFGTDNMPALLEQYRLEVKQLRLEVLQQGVEFGAWKINLLETKLQQLRQEQSKLKEQEHTIQQLLADLNGQSSDSQTEPNQTDEISGLKESLGNRELKGIAQKQQPILQAEADLQERLSLENKRMQELQAQIARLKANR